MSLLLGESEVTLEFSESLLASTILSKIEALHLLYTVQIVPRTDTVSHSGPSTYNTLSRYYPGQIR